MLTVPAAIPVTIPLTGSMDPKDGLLLLHVPDAEASDKVVVDPIHALNIPVIGSIGFTVT